MKNVLANIKDCEEFVKKYDKPAKTVSAPPVESKVVAELSSRMAELQAKLAAFEAGKNPGRVDPLAS